MAFFILSPQTLIREIVIMTITIICCYLNPPPNEFSKSVVWFVSRTAVYCQLYYLRTYSMRKHRNWEHGLASVLSHVVCPVRCCLGQTFVSLLSKRRGTRYHKGLERWRQPKCIVYRCQMSVCQFCSTVAIAVTGVESLLRCHEVRFCKDFFFSAEKYPLGIILDALLCIQTMHPGCLFRVHFILLLCLLSYMILKSFILTV